MSGLSRERLEEIRGRVEAATPGPWEFWTGGTFVSRYQDYATVICDTLLDAEMRGRLPKGHSENNGQFIAHSSTDVPDLLADNDRLRKEVFDAGDDVSELLDLLERCRPAVAVWEDEQPSDCDPTLAADIDRQLAGRDACRAQLGAEAGS